MGFSAVLFNLLCNWGDKKKIKDLRTPGDIERRDNLSYGDFGKWNLLDIYYPRGTSKPIPTIVSIHGGGYVYGDKEIYQYYCMHLAQQGFVVVNFNYRLAPKVKYPSIITEVNQVMQWICEHSKEYHIDTNNLFLVGDSAGAQMASQYATIVTNPDYAKLFDFKVPSFTLRAIGLNCGMYDKTDQGKGFLFSIVNEYFKNNTEQHKKQLDVLKYITKEYPPAHITSAPNDFLLANADPMHQFLQAKGVKSECKIYGTKEQKEVAHVFHVDIRSAEAKQCNEEQCSFFKQFVMA